MSQVDSLSPDGVRSQIQGGTPLPLSPEQSEDALDTLEFGSVLQLVAGYAVGPMGAARVLGRRPTVDIEWIRTELARVAEVASLFRRGDSLRAEPIPDVTRALSILRIEGSVLEGVELAALQRVLGAARNVSLDLKRVADLAPLSAQLIHPLPDKAIERRLEQSLDPDGNLLDTRQSRAGRSPARGSVGASAPASATRQPTSRTRPECGTR